MEAERKTFQVPVYLGESLFQIINERLPRNIKISVLARWLLRAIVLTPKELEVVCRSNDEEARTIGPYLHDALQKLFEAGKNAAGVKNES